VPLALIRLLLVDDHAVVRAGYRRLLEQHPHIRVIAEAESGEQGYLEYVAQQPDVVVMDLSLPGVGGLEALRRIRLRDPAARILVFSMHEEAIFAERSLEAGALGYITKSSAPEVLVEAIEEVAAGRVFVGPDLSGQIWQQGGAQSSPLKLLTPREFEVFRLLVRGFELASIARALGVSYKTAANYSTTLRSKLQVSTDAQLVHLALRYGLLKA
jgi:two-component system invasion response regulator UvrY